MSHDGIISFDELFKYMVHRTSRYINIDGEQHGDAANYSNACHFHDNKPLNSNVPNFALCKIKNLPAQTVIFRRSLRPQLTKTSCNKERNMKFCIFKSVILK
jgi:hypothetical protein